jgi:hypothetical protein
MEVQEEVEGILIMLTLVLQEELEILRLQTLHKEIQVEMQVVFIQQEEEAVLLHLVQMAIQDLVMVEMECQVELVHL